MTRQEERDDAIDVTARPGAGADQADAARQQTAPAAQAAMPEDLRDVREDELEAEVGLVDQAESRSFQERWTDAQSRFVDDPRAAVSEADGLVADVMQSVARGFAHHKSALEEQWSRDDQPDTEQLRQALQRYRSFFSRLLAT